MSGSAPYIKLIHYTRKCHTICSSSSEPDYFWPIAANLTLFSTPTPFPLIINKYDLQQHWLIPGLNSAICRIWRPDPSTTLKQVYRVWRSSITQGTLDSSSNYTTYCTWWERLSFEILLAFHLPSIPNTQPSYEGGIRYPFEIFRAFPPSSPGFALHFVKFTPKPVWHSFKLCYFCEWNFFWRSSTVITHMADIDIRVTFAISREP